MWNLFRKRPRRSVPVSRIPSLAFGGGSSPAQLSYPVIIAQQWSAVFNGQDPGTDGTTQGYDFGSLDVSSTLLDALQTAIDTGSPFADVEAFDPDDVLTRIETARDNLNTAVDAFTDPADTVTDMAASAATAVDTSVITTAAIEDAVDAYADRRRPEFNRALSNVMAGYYMANAAVGNQMGMALMGVVRDYETNIADFDGRLTAQAEQDRSRAVLHVTEMGLRTFQLRYQMLTQSLQAEVESGRFEITAKQDQTDKDLMYSVKDTQWELDLFDYPFKGMGALGGAAVVPRAQTQGERLLGAVGNALSAGLSVGTTFGSPAIGGIAAAGMLGAEAFTSLVDKR